MPSKRPEWKDSKYADAKGRKPAYASKMKCARKFAMKKLGNAKK